MIYFVFAQLFSFLLDLFTTTHSPEYEKDLQLLLLRQQLRIFQRKQAQTQRPRISRWEKSILAVLSARLKALPGNAGKRLDECILLFKPDTVLRWHRESVRRKWTYQRRALPGKPHLAPEVEQLIVRLATKSSLGL